MDKKQIDDFLEKHGLADYVGMYGGAIEMDRQDAPGGISTSYWDSYAFISLVIEKAKEEAMDEYMERLMRLP